MSTHVHAMEILEPGPQATFQDLGRHGLASMGISPSGSFDRAAAVRANSAVGNAHSATVIEILVGGFSAKILTHSHIAITGAQAKVTITSPQGRMSVHHSDSVISVEPRDVIHIHPAERGLRCYLAIRDGFATACVLGSASSDTLSGLGLAPLKRGDVVSVAKVSTSTSWHPSQRSLVPARSMRAPVILDFIRGPRDDWFTSEAFHTFCTQDYEVGTDSNRVGIRLIGAHRLERAIDRELPSEPMVRGAIQIPPSGQPVIFGPDFPVTGGYPVIGVLNAEASDACAQLAPGDIIRFRQHHFTE